jgi:hypothetical protein
MQKPKMPNRDQQRVGCLEQLRIWITHEQRSSGLFRTLVDSWYAFDRGGALLSRSGEPHWFNKPDPHKKGHCKAIFEMGWYVSVEAIKLFENPDLFEKKDPARSLIKDHAVPLAVLRCELRKIDPTTPAIEAFLRKNYHVAIITKQEHQDLDDCGLQSIMPVGWNDPYARYAGKIERARIDDYPALAARRNTINAP